MCRVSSRIEYFQRRSSFGMWVCLAHLWGSGVTNLFPFTEGIVPTILMCSVNFKYTVAVWP